MNKRARRWIVPIFLLGMLCGCGKVYPLAQAKEVPEHPDIVVISKLWHPFYYYGTDGSYHYYLRERDSGETVYKIPSEKHIVDYPIRYNGKRRVLLNPY